MANGTVQVAHPTAPPPPPPSNHPYGEALFVPSDRDGSRAVFSGTEAAVYLVGGHRTTPDQGLVPTREIWRYDLLSDVWQPVVANVLTETIPADPLAIAYDASSQTIVFIDEGAGTGSRRIVKVDLKNNVIRAVATLPALRHSVNYSLAYDANGEYVLIRGELAVAQYTTFRFRVDASSVAWLGQGTFTGSVLDDAFVTPSGILAPIAREQGGAQDLVSITTPANTSTPASL